MNRERMVGTRLRHIVLTALALLSVLSSSSRLAAQDAALLVPGARVRVSSHTAPRDMGSFVALRADSLIYQRLAATGDTVLLPFSEIWRLEVSRGKHHHPWRGLAIGALVGGAVGAIAGAVTYRPCHSSGEGWCILSPTPGEDAIAYGILGAAGGGLIGLVIGANVRSERWQRIPIDHLRGHIRIEPAAGRSRLTFTMGLAM